MLYFFWFGPSLVKAKVEAPHWPPILALGLFGLLTIYIRIPYTLLGTIRHKNLVSGAKWLGLLTLGFIVSSVFLAIRKSVFNF